MTLSVILELIKTLAALAGAGALVLAYVQLKRTIQWNRLSASLAYLDSLRFADAEVRVAEALKSFELNYSDDDLKLSDSIADKIIITPAVYMPLRHFLNLLELAAAGINAGAIDEEFAYHHRGDYYLHNWELFEPLVLRIRRRVGNNKYWSENQKLCSDWQKRKDNDEKPSTVTRRYKHEVA